MKRSAIIFMSVLSLAACGKESSPDGRSQLRDEKIQIKIDSLKGQINMLRDSMYLINKQLKDLK